MRDVAEAYVTKLDIALGIFNFLVALVRYLRFCVYEVEDALSAGKSVLKLGYNAAYLVEWLGILVCIVEQTTKASHADSSTHHRESSTQAYCGIYHRVYKPCSRIYKR